MIPPNRAKLSEGISFSQIESSPLEVNQSSPSPIEKLPRELAFAIFEYVPECVENLRMASTALLNRVNEFALQRTTIQLVDELLFETNYRKDHRIYVTLVLPQNMSYLFELRYQLRRKSIAKNRLLENRRGHLTFYIFNLRKNVDEMWKSISAAIGTRIDRVSIIVCYEKSIFETIISMLESLKFKNFEVASVACGCGTNISNYVADALLDIVATKEIDHLEMSLEISFIDDEEQFLIKMSSLVRSLHFKPSYIFRAPLSEARR